MKKILPLFSLALLMPVCASAAPTTSPSSDFRWGSKYLFEYEHLTPTSHNQQITTDSIHAMIGKKLSDTWDFSVFGGLTATTSDGHITRDGVNRDSSADGLGPLVRFQVEPWHSGPVGLTLFASGGLIFYNEDFPSGGRSYNFMWRAGPTLNFKVTDQTTLSAGATWMHVSNGRDSRNPRFDGSGVLVGLTHSF